MLWIFRSLSPSGKTLPYKVLYSSRNDKISWLLWYLWTVWTKKSNFWTLLPWLGQNPTVRRSCWGDLEYWWWVRRWLDLTLVSNITDQWSSTSHGTVHCWMLTTDLGKIDLVPIARILWPAQFLYNPSHGTIVTTQLLKSPTKGFVRFYKLVKTLNWIS